MTIAVSGGNLRGELLASFRPPPVVQADMARVKQVIPPDEFKDSVALIVGGSRGLGEITARLIAAGGGFAHHHLLPRRRRRRKSGPGYPGFRRALPRAALRYSAGAGVP